jgi:hypothetical protein
MPQAGRRCRTNLYLADVFFYLEPKGSLCLKAAHALRRARTRVRNVEQWLGTLVGYNKPVDVDAPLVLQYSESVKTKDL